MKGKKRLISSRKIRKVTSLILTLVLIFSLIVVPTNAAEKVYRYSGLVDAGYHYTAILGVREWDGTTLIGGIHQTYCADITIFTNTTIDYHLVDLTDGNVRAIMLNSYPNVSLAALEAAALLPASSLTAQDAITATQYAIWFFTNAFSQDGDLTADQLTVLNYLKGLAAVPASTAPSSAAFTSTSSTILPNGDVEIVVSYPVNATSTNSDSTPIPLTLTYSIDIGTVYPGSVIVATTDGTTNTETITIPAAVFTSDINFSATISGIQTIFDAHIFERLNPEEEVQPLVGFINREIDVTASVDIEVLKEDGSIEILKVIQDRSEDLTTFEVLITGPEEYQETVYISQSGPVLLSGLAYGTYTLTEILPEGYYAASSNPMIVILSGDESGARVTFVNALTPVIEFAEITVVKEVSNVDDDPTEFEVVINGFFKLYVKDGTSASIILPLGTFTVVETAVDGYKNVSITPSTFTLTTAGQTVVVVNEKEIIPPPTGAITITKEFEEGVTDTSEFTVNISGPSGYTNSVIIAQGSPVIISDLELGEYTLTEVSIEGYVNLSAQTVTVGLDEETLEVSVTFINGLEEIIIPPEGPPGDLPETGGASPINYFGFGSLIVLTGILVLFIQKKREETFS